MRQTGQDLLQRLSARIDPERIARRTLEMAAIPSLAGQEGDMARCYAGYLRESGLQVEFDYEFPESPSVIARLPGGPGPVLQFDGHLDTVPNPHAPPARRGDVIFGRGACDMKGGLAVLAEIAQVLASAGVQLGGSLLFTAHGQHEEAAAGRPLHAPLLGLLRRGIKGDACIIPEGPHDELPIAGKGLVIFTARFERPGEPVHEILSGPVPPPNPNMAAHRFISLMQERAAQWEFDDPLVGKESVFFGSVHGGDLYNRIPVRAEISGTRRYPVGRSFEAARSELVQVADEAAAAVGVRAYVTVERSGQPFRLAETEPVVAALRKSYHWVMSEPLPLAGMRYSGDVSQFINAGGVPAVYHGTDQRTAHADVESVPVQALERCARTLLGAALAFLGTAPAR